MWTISSKKYNQSPKQILYQFRYKDTQLYIVIAESKLLEQEKHFQLFFQGVNYYHNNPSSQVYFNPSNCEKIYGFPEPPFYQGFNYAKLGEE